MICVVDYCVMLIDVYGVMIDYWIDCECCNDFCYVGLYIGLCWLESEEGICGVVSVLIDFVLIIVYKIDYFCVVFMMFMCSVVLIFLLGGELIGVFDVLVVYLFDGCDS